MGRDAKGKFEKGTSGNNNGRPKAARKKLQSLEDLDKIVLEVASRPMTVRSAGGQETVTMFQANLMGLASGSLANRMAAKNFIDTVRRSAGAEDSRRRRREDEERRQNRTRSY